jgi:hypothetical protein
MAARAVWSDRDFSAWIVAAILQVAGHWMMSLTGPP